MYGVVVMSVILCGYHNMGCVALDVLNELGVEVSALFTHRDDPDENRWFSTPAPLAEKRGIPVYYPENINQAKWEGLIRELEPEILLSCYYRNMIGERILSIPSVAAVNLHGSLLPGYRGRCPVNWQLVNGERESGVTLHHMVKQADAGDIIGMKAVAVSREDDAVSLYGKLEAAARELLGEFIPRLLDGTAPRVAQDHEKATYFGGRRPEDGRIDWSWPSERIYNLTRAVAWPYPGAFAMLDGKKIMFWKVRVMDDIPGDRVAPGTVIRLDDGSLAVGTGSGMVGVVCVTEDGGSPEKAADPATVLTPGVVLG